ncbi:MAG: hypothetical protein IJ681_01945 [Bacteroidales bacterium]|nr:hypothetical protein [Bacteroidales bacterium]
MDIYHILAEHSKGKKLLKKKKYKEAFLCFVTAEQGNIACKDEIEICKQNLTKDDIADVKYLWEKTNTSQTKYFSTIKRVVITTDVESFNNYNEKKQSKEKSKGCVYNKTNNPAIKGKKSDKKKKEIQTVPDPQKSYWKRFSKQGTYTTSFTPKEQETQDIPVQKLIEIGDKFYLEGYYERANDYYTQAKKNDEENPELQQKIQDCINHTNPKTSDNNWNTYYLDWNPYKVDDDV